MLLAGERHKSVLNRQKQGKATPSRVTIKYDLLKMKIVLLLLLFAVNAYASGNYSTTFPLTENPISENENWINGKDVGLDWCNVATSSGLAFGTQSGSSYAYDDSTAVLSGTWGPNQTVQATVVSGNQNTNAVEEVELRLRTTITPHSITGYELDFRNASPGGYVAIVRWNGPLNSFTTLAEGNNAYHGIQNGDILKATIVDSVITVYVNNVLVCQATDSTYKNGSPGVGFWLSQGPASLNANYGFSSFSATDGSSPTPTPTPTPPPTPAATPYTAWETSLISELQSLRINNTNINKIQAWLKANPPYP
jgi:hypothetical protein